VKRAGEVDARAAGLQADVQNLCDEVAAHAEPEDKVRACGRAGREDGRAGSMGDGPVVAYVCAWWGGRGRGQAAVYCLGSIGRGVLRAG